MLVRPSLCVGIPLQLNSLTQGHCEGRPSLGLGTRMVCLSDVCRNPGGIIKASGSFLNEVGGQTLCIAHGSTSKTSPIFSIIQVRIALFLSGTGNIHEAEGIYI